MAMPDMVISSKPIPAIFIGGRAYPVQKHIDYEWGGIAISDPSKGLMYQIWKARMENNYVYLSAPNTPEFVLLDLPKVTEISFTFDQNCRHIFVYVQDGVSKMHWYDTSAGGYITTILGGDVKTPRVTLDDKRSSQLGISDVLVFYQKGNSLYMRVQRERYLVEHLLATNVTDGIVKVGMMNNLRVGVQLAQYHPPTIVK